MNDTSDTHQFADPSSGVSRKTSPLHQSSEKLRTKSRDMEVTNVILGRICSSARLPWSVEAICCLVLWKQFGAWNCVIVLFTWHLIVSIVQYRIEQRCEWTPKPIWLDSVAWMRLQRKLPWPSLVGPTLRKQWINQSLEQFWPHIRRYVQNSLQKRQLWFGLQCIQIELGHRAPIVQRIRVQADKWSKARWTRNAIGDRLLLELDVHWMASSDQQLTLSWFLGTLKLARVSLALELDAAFYFESRNTGAKCVQIQLSLKQTPKFYEYEPGGWLIFIDWLCLLRPMLNFLCDWIVEPRNVTIRSQTKATDCEHDGQPKTSHHRKQAEFQIPIGLLQVKTSQSID